MGSAYILYGAVGLMLVAGMLILPLKMHHVSAQSEAALLARNLNDAARSALATPSDADAWVDVRLPDRLGGKRYAVAFMSNRLWIGLEDRRLFNYSTNVTGFEIFTGGEVVRLLKRAGSGSVEAVRPF